MRLRFTLAALGLGASITAGCGVLLDLSHLDDGTGSGGGSTVTGASASASSGGGGLGGAPATSSASSGATTATATSGAGTGGASASSSASSGSTSASSSSSSTGGPTFKDLAVDIVIAGPPAQHFKIDSTEVTVTSYAAFIQAFEAETPADQQINQHPVCTWNHSVRPNTITANDAGIVTAPECTNFNLDTEVMNDPKAPMRCIDWCDAAAYCIWAGGHMCQGDEGGQGYPVEWKNACQGQNGDKFPYGPTYQAGRCVDAPAAKVADVGSKPICIGGYAGIFDMSGNVAEWLNCGCEYDNMDSTKTNAFIGGGAYHNTGDELDCTPVATTPIIGFRKDVGVRCCYDP